MMNTFSKMDVIPAAEIVLGFVSFFTISLGGLIIGVSLGILSSLTLKHCSYVRVVEPMMVFLFAYLSYLCAELFHFSGIISTIGCGLMQTQYAFHNISSKSFTTVKYFTKMLSAISEAVIFLFLGQALVSPNHRWHTGFVLWTVILCLFVRFLSVFGLSYLANRYKKLRKLDWHEQFIMAYGGLRGAVSFSLAVMLDNDFIPMKNMFVTTTLVVVLFTVFIQGITIKPLVKLMHIALQKENGDSLVLEINDHVRDHLLAGVEEVIGRVGENLVRQKLEYVDGKYMRRWLLKDGTLTRYEGIMSMYEKMALDQHFTNLPGSKVAADHERRKTLIRQKTVVDPYSSESSLIYMVGQDEVQMRHVMHHPEIMDNRRTRRLSADIMGFPTADEDSPAKTNRFSNSPKIQLDRGKKQWRDLRKLMAYRPSTALHQVYNKDLINDDDQDLMHQLHHKSLLSQRMVRARSVLTPTGSDQSLDSNTGMNPRSTGVSLQPIPETGLEEEPEGDQTGDAGSKKTPQKEKKPTQRRPQLVKSRSIDMYDMDEPEHQSSPLVDSKSRDSSSVV